jgi:hypothetical protein
MRRVLLPALTAVLALLAAAAVTLAAGPPAATTGGAEDLAQSQATLTATVDPNGVATTVRFDIGTSTAYGLQSQSRDVSAGDDPVPVRIPVSGLTGNTTYHYRVVATSADGTAQGADATFRTPSRPSVTTGSVAAIVNDGGTLTGRVTPRGQATQAHFEYGTTTALGASTAAVDLAPSFSSSAVRLDVRGLQPNTRYHYRLVAANATGTTRGGDRTFVTGSQPGAVTLDADTARVPFGGVGAVSGRVAGPKLGGIKVHLQLQQWPFTGGFADYGRTATTSSVGSFRITISPLTIATQVRAVAGSPGVTSPVVTMRSTARVAITRVRRTKRRTTVRGRVRPATTAGVVTLQRRTSTRRWARLGRARVRIDGGWTVRFERPRRAILVRAVADPRDGGAHDRGISRRSRIAR